jgi:hypothetical protein
MLAANGRTSLLVGLGEGGRMHIEAGSIPEPHLFITIHNPQEKYAQIKVR